MLHRRHVDDRWVACEPRDAGHETDSGVHRYDRVHGFAVTDEELAMMARNPAVAAAERRSRSANKQVSHMQSVARWSWFDVGLQEGDVSGRRGGGHHVSDGGWT